MNESTNEMLDLNLLGNALAGGRGPDQQRIARVGLEWITTILKKNADYGSSVWRKPMLAPECDVDAAIRVRMSDKVERIASLLQNDRAEVEESLEDTITDLGS